MTALDPFTAASPTFLQAARHAFRQGSALEVMPGRFRWHVLAAVVGGAAAILFSLVTR